MAALNRETLRSDTEWFVIDDATASGAARRAAVRLAGRLGFDESRAGDVAIVTTEVSSNLYRHAHGARSASRSPCGKGRPG